MNELHGSGANAFSSSFASSVMGAISSRSLNNMQPACPPSSVTPDGSKFFTDDSGAIVYAQYASGAIVIKQPKVVAVRTADGDYWMGRSNCGWYRVD